MYSGELLLTVAQVSTLMIHPNNQTSVTRRSKEDNYKVFSGERWSHKWKVVIIRHCIVIASSRSQSQGPSWTVLSGMNFGNAVYINYFLLICWWQTGLLANRLPCNALHADCQLGLELSSKEGMFMTVTLIIKVVSHIKFPGKGEFLFFPPSTVI